jgi:hypothetical protein
MRLLGKLLAILVVVFIVAWLGLWWYAQGRMESGVTGWIAQASNNPNVKFTYDSLARGTSPLAATVTVTNLRATIQVPNDDTPAVITLPSFTLRIAAANPTIVHVDYPGQINITASKGDASITFGSIGVQEHIDPAAFFNPAVPPFRSADAQASNINLLASSGSLQVLHIDSVTVHAAINHTAGPSQTAIALTENFQGLALSSLLTKIASVPFDGKINQFGITFNASGPLPPNWQTLATQINALPIDDQQDRAKIVLTALHGWAAAGGSGNFSLSLGLGPSTLNADAAVKFDANVQPSGTANLTANHLDAFSAAIVNAYPSTEDSVNQAQAQLSPYLSTTNDGGQVLNLHVTYGNGAVNLNGQQVSPMPPLDWNALENLTPPPPADSGQ